MKLLVLDIDETLVFGTEDSLEREPDFIVGPYSIYKRPGLDEFLASVRSLFQIAIWTSSTKPYADEVVPNIIPKDLELSFTWSRERCTRRFDSELYEYEWAKNLSKLKRVGYKLEDVLMVDDTPAKLSNHYGNLVRVKPFFGDDSDTELHRLAAYLPSLADVPNVRNIEKRYWRSKSD
jgi:carboxy-terminal domain RNA polymerase II polypeptide A small phosphatase